MLRSLAPASEVRGRTLQGQLVHLRKLERVRPDVLDQIRFRRDAVRAEVEVHRGWPNPVAVAVEGDRDRRFGSLGETVDVVAAVLDHDGGVVQIVQQPVLLVDVQIRTVDDRAASRADGVEDPGDAEVRSGLFGTEAGHAADQPLGHVLLGAREHAQLVGVRLGRRREVPLRLVAVVFEVVARRVVQLVARVEPGAAAVAVHACAESPEQGRDVVRRDPFLCGAVLEHDLAGQLVVPADGSVLRGDFAPVARGGAQQGQSDLLDQSVLLRRVQLRRRLCHREHFDCSRARTHPA